MRQSRKLEHLKYSVLLEDGPNKNGFSDFKLVHNCLPDMALDDVNLTCSVAGLKLHHPIIINAVTGGGDEVTEVNAMLAKLAYATQSPMAVGSQFAALEYPDVKDSYNVVNQFNPGGIVIANLGAHVTPKQAREAVTMIEAKAIQIHLNPAQELFMPEGDRNFTGYLANIARIAEAVSVPVIVKEVGFGIAREQAMLLACTGIKAIDVGGAGGTNFVAIEAARTKARLSHETLSWGIPTAISAVEVSSAVSDKVDIIISGGIRTPLDAVKALVMGGCAVGIAGPLIKLLYKHGLADCVTWFNQFLDDIKCYMLLLGTRQVQELTKVPVVVTGGSREWLTTRGIDVVQYANR